MCYTDKNKFTDKIYKMFLTKFDVIYQIGIQKYDERCS